MPSSNYITLDANEAVASVAYRLSEVIALYPITPASAMGEACDEWSAGGRKNLWGQVPHTVEMQSEAGAAGAVHGVLQAGALATTFTASQGLLLMFPNMFKIAGELTPFVLHVAARTIATHGLSIFGDHSDVMSARSTGFAMLCASSVQEAQDFAAISHAATLKTRIPFLHFFDGFRTSHEVSRIAAVDDDVLKGLALDDDIRAFRDRKLTPDAPLLRGTAQNPDTFFQARESGNRYYEACPGLVQQVMDRFAALTGRRYQLFERFGHPEPERLIIAMGSGVGALQEAVEWMVKKGEKVGGVVVRLFRPFDLTAFLATLPASVKRIAVLDRTKEPGAVGEPLFQDVVAALFEAGRLNSVQVIGGRYGLSSKEFTPAMVRGVFDELAKPTPKRRFTIGINDDVTQLSLPYDAEFDLEPPETVRAMFYGLGADGTVSANKQAIKIIGEYAGLNAQGYFVYDSKKSGAITISHLRFGTQPIRSTYKIAHASFVACHYQPILERTDVLANAAPGATFLLNTSKPADQAFAALPLEVQKQILEKRLHFHVIDAFQVAQQAGLGRHISAVMQTCFFALSGVLPRDQAIARIREGVEKAYGKRGSEVVERNFKAIDLTLANLHEVKVPTVLNGAPRPPTVPKEAPDFVQRVTATMMRGEGDLLPVSAFPVDGTWPTGTTKFERRAIALELPTWDAKLCIQCNKCSLICPHAAIRSQLVDPASLGKAPATFVTTEFKSKDLGTAPSGAAWKYALQVAPDDCTGCGLCVAVCPARDKTNPRHKAIDMNPIEPIRDTERANWAFFEQLPWIDRTKVKDDVKASQFLEPLFEFSGACSGCGETPYVKLLSQLVGDRLLVANATGCSSIFGGNLPTTPYTKNREGRGPAWANSLFEDNAEFGFGLRLAADAQQRLAADLLSRVASRLPQALVDGLTTAKQDDDAGIIAQRERVAALKKELAKLDGPDAKHLLQLADSLVKKSVWLIGGDGWAYDIGFGGLDHVLSTGAHVKALVLDTEVYSNTGGQQSKATPLGASAKFSVAGKAQAKKDLGLLAMSYGNCYVASIAMGAKDNQALKALKEAEAFPGPALVIAYSHCIAHAFDLKLGAEQQRLAVDSGIWPLYRFDPRRLLEGQAPLQLDAPAPKLKARDFMKNEGRFRLVEMKDPKRYAGLLDQADANAARRRAVYEQLAAVHLEESKKETP
ncbi:MAG: pyruvate:ferredoxin (flavodoxin) oxidoreductase [Myxococcaceae bacterium]|nr:pyruvate:ferredoxin (flavodoxin) oxidoreductase [Myxococcaceae bacterium]